MTAALACWMALVAAAPTPPTTIALDFSGLNSAPGVSSDELLSQASSRLSQQGFAVTASSNDADLVIRAVSAADGVDLLALGRGQVRSVHVVQGADLVRVLEELVRDALALPEATPPPPAEPTAVTEPPPEPATGRAPAKRVTVALGASAVWRSVVDPMVSFAVRRGGPVGIGYGGELDFTPSVGPGVSVQETGLLVGASYRWNLRRGVDLDVGGRAGLLARYDALTNPQTSPASSWRVAALIEAPVEVVAWLSPKTSMGLRLAPGVTTSNPAIYDAGQSLWARTLVRLDAGVSLQHTF